MVIELRINKWLIYNTRKVFNFCEKVVWHTKKTCDVLIFDAESSDDLVKCIPEKCRIFIFRNRTEQPLFISVKFFFYLIQALIRYKKLNIAIMIAIFKYLNPKVIITFIDNSSAIPLIKKTCSKIPFFAIQNGIRWDFSIKNREQMNYDYYFSFGSVEADIFSQDRHIVANFYPIGSIRASIFREMKSDLNNKIFDLCFISQFDPVPVNSAGMNEWNFEVLINYFDTGKKYFDIVVKYAIENNLSLCVAMRSAQNSLNYTSEYEYFSNHYHKNITYIPQSKFSSYRAVQDSQLSLTISSTLGYEALGWGERVIFAKDVQSVNSLVMQGGWDNNLVTHKLPELQRLYSLDYSELNFKVMKILEMTDENYIEYSKIAREYYMNYYDNKKPHEFIKQKIIELM